MCGVCGCESGGARARGKRRRNPLSSNEAAEGHGHDHSWHRRADPAAGRPDDAFFRVEQDILAKNDAFAAENRRWFAERNILALNLVSSPGAGKTSLLVAIIGRIRPHWPVAVIEGDQETDTDADRVRQTGASAIQINTGRGCHLDAHMVGHAAADLDAPNGSVLFIENVGNLVCPAAFDLGEASKVAILSTTEGADKPLKYPDMFMAADLLLLNKVDLLPHLDFDPDEAIGYARRVNPEIEVVEVSARTGYGLDRWIEWLGDRRRRLAPASSVSSADAETAGA